jgi:hypothetical protein
MSKTFRVTFQEWQLFEVFVPAKTADAAVLIAETMRHSLGTIRPITECDGGTEAFEASDVSALDPLTTEAILQAATLIGALADRRPLELAEGWRAAWETGPRWRAKLEAGHQRLPDAARRLLAEVLKRAGESRKRRKAHT